MHVYAFDILNDTNEFNLFSNSKKGKKMTSQYTVNVQPATLDRDPSTQSRFHGISELPKVLKLGLKYSPRRNPKTYLFIQCCGGGIGSFQMFTFITGSPILGAILAVCFMSGAISMMFIPDFSKGIFLEMLLADKEHTETIAKSIKSNAILNVLTFDLIFIPIVTYFMVVPLATTTELLGPYTYIISPIMWTITVLSLIPGAVFELGGYFSLEIGRVWDIKIKNYLKIVHDILLQQDIQHNDPEANILVTGADVTDRLSIEYEKVEKWASIVNRETSGINNGTMLFSFGFALVNILLIASGVGGKNRVATIVTLTILSILMLLWGLQTLYSAAKPSFTWENTKIKLLNDPKIQRAIVKIGWAERWENWLHHHELNASKIFGVKVTMSAMRNVGSAIASLFAIVMYFLLRNELRELASI